MMDLSGFDGGLSGFPAISGLTCGSGFLAVACFEWFGGGAGGSCRLGQ